MNDPQKLNQRVVDLESMIMILQRDLEQMSSVVHDQQRQIEDLQTQIDHWNDKFASDLDDLPDPLDEKPPHY
ncbi:SlyX family protein [Rubinisphaera margarita]|uniref:SlyX family protein n=1 Tax=Rubinisphaera margarita TaxID=2909586 RepID=UPI001EE7C3EA|nr:SlyX family protein [Rubinisphaera margarita]MCG6154488.1 SlyX family protein [Rubinisphaera margarita]